MPSEEDKAKAIAELETEEEKKAREEAGLEGDKPRRGRPPGTKNQPKMSDETLRAGCRSFVKFCWLLSRGFCALFGWSIEPPLEETEIEEGAKEAENLVKRFPIFVILLSVIGFPVWLFGKVLSRLKRREVEKKLPAPSLEVVKPEATHGN